MKVSVLSPGAPGTERLKANSCHSLSLSPLSLMMLRCLFDILGPPADLLWFCPAMKYMYIGLSTEKVVACSAGASPVIPLVPTWLAMVKALQVQLARAWMVGTAVPVTPVIGLV